ncbi:DEAD/DEAH box helicase family protein [Flavobacterium sp. SUN046]|uniref:TOTE conflict system archaeo-eukaryotic primase domain-containing protein n=1 Tax=Flavobacterium sp. SUN046 TaxID=3002440 RepID=UPI002DBC5E05|nr:DEAD/DEAH box helicase family protein [Flavobacterium sp. SUN046]MEC4050062.1 DEAD/DEAH box helicase family protein [Flavobacterium sp. SUN046]
MNDNPNIQIKLFQSLFKGREDVFAIRWEKSGKSGYMPAYQYDPYHYRAHKMNGGNFQNYPHKTYLSLTDNEFQKHFNGIQQIGVYPLLQDNTSWFLVADFDKQNWKIEAVNFLNACKEEKIPAYLERSRSGNGGHVWIFFEKPYAAIRSRKIFISILEESGIFSMFDKSSSFDRLFPNQDFLSGKGFGNLIALPFFKPALEKGNSCFINPVTFEPITDQWQFLKEINRVSIDVLENIFQNISTTQNLPIPKNNNGKLTISLQQNIYIQRNGLTSPLILFLREELNFANSEFFIKKKSGKNTFGTERYFKLVEETENEIIIPRGFIGKFLRFCKEQKIDFDFQDHRKLKESITFSFHATLRTHQNKAVEIVSKKDFGVIVAPPGSGKTIIGLKIVSEKKQPALIVVHRIQLLEQWQERVQTFLGIPKHEIGIIGKGKAKIGEQITIATIQSLPKQMEQIQNQFGTILVDECHHIPAETFRSTIEKLNTFYLYGLTATPFRKYNDEKLIFAFLGEIISEAESNEIENFKHAQIIVRNTNLDIPFNPKTESFETLSKILIHDSERNKLILNDIKIELSKGKRIAIITERKDHIDTLCLFLKQSYEVVTLSGDDSESNKKSKWQTLQQANFQILITTGQYFGEGSDLSNINSLFLVYPFSFKGKLIQYIGRVQRSEINPTIYDFRDIKIDYLNKLFLKRNVYYRQIMKQASLFDEPTEFISERQSLIIEKQIKIPIEDLEFGYGYVSFEYIHKSNNIRLDFEIENEEFRVEFEVLKPYFIKVLKSKTVSIAIYAEIENGVILSQLAISSDIENINKEIVESVKFQFLDKSFIRQISSSKQNILTTNNLTKNQNIYENAEVILENLMNRKHYKHSKNIQFLAEKHKRNVMKLRFVLQPFSFVFLLSGEKNYHIILETLDTEEATYIWHTEKNKSLLIDTIKHIENELNIIREKGRQVYLESNPHGFSKIVHDYSNDDKGFVVWKGQLEERLI